MKARNLYIIIRGDKPQHHNAPFHPIIVCSRKHTAKWETKDITEGSTLLYNADNGSQTANWFLGMYKGYGCDSNKYFTLFDGTDSRAFSDKRRIEVEVLKNAIWWSYDECPEWLLTLGVKYPTDEFTKKRILDDSGTCVLSDSVSRKLKTKLQDRDTPSWLKINSPLTEEV